MLRKRGTASQRWIESRIADVASSDFSSTRPKPTRLPGRKCSIGEMRTIPGRGHGDFQPDETVRIYATIREFLRQHVGAK